MGELTTDAGHLLPGLPPKALLEKPAAVTPQDLGLVLDVAAQAPTTLVKAYALNSALQKLIALANQPYPIGALVPEATTESPFPLNADEAELPDYSPARGYIDTRAP